MTHSEMLAWLNGFLAAKGTAAWTLADFKRVRTVLDEAEKRITPVELLKQDANPAPSLKDLIDRAPKTPPTPLFPLFPLPQQQPVERYAASQCAVCHMNFEGPMGYVCGNANCPSRISCGGVG